MRIVALDPSGKIIMLPYGWDGTKFIPLLVDEEGRGITVIKGAADVQWGLRGWWKFIASEETTIKDYSGYGNNGVSYSGVGEAATYVDGVIGQAFKFDGDNDYITIPDSDSLDIDGEFTIEVWGYRLAASGDPVEYLVYKKLNYYLGVLGDGRVRLEYWASDGEVYEHDSIDSIPMGTWVHIVVVSTSDPSVVILYINNEVKAAAGLHVTQSANYTHSLFFGDNGLETRNFEGYIDEVRIYGRALSNEEVAWRYNNTNPATGKPTRMVAVDNEGRMMVNIQDLPYKDTVLILDYVNDHPAGTVKIEFDPVPAGKLWVLSNCTCRCMLDDSGTTSLYIRRGDDYYMIGELMRTMLYDTLNFRGPAYLKAGDILACWFSAVDLNSACQVYANGYSLNA